MKKYLKITIETDEKKEVYGNSVESSKLDGQNAGPAPEVLTTESVSTRISEIGTLHTDPSVIDGGTPPQHLLEALQFAAPSQKSMSTSVIDDAGPAPTDNRE